jgi:glutamyl-tRNA reductase
MKARRDRPLALIDIAVPRDIDPEVQLVPGVYLYDIDDLEAIVRENIRSREQELAQCRTIIEEETAEVMAKLAPPPMRRPEPRIEAGTAGFFLAGTPAYAE